jgi:hypothetical protein
MKQAFARFVVAGVNHRSSLLMFGVFLVGVVGCSGVGTSF